MVRRYESAEGDGYDDYAHYQARRSGGGAVNRYEVGRQSLKSLQASVKATKIIVFTSGDRPLKSDKGDKYKIPPVQIMFSRKKFPNLDSLFEEITGRTKRLVSRLYKWPLGQRVCNVSEIAEENESNLYVCSNDKALVINIDYGGVGHAGSPFSEKFSRSSHDSRGTLRSEKRSPQAVRSHGSMNGGSKVPPVTIVVTCNTNRDSTSSLIIDTKSTREFEKILENIEEMLDVEDPPIKALYSTKKPYKKVDSYSSLNMVLRSYGNTFWACGRDGPPVELKYGSRDTSPMRNGYQQRQKYGNKSNGYHDIRTRQSNGYMRQSETYEDSHGRSYQRHHQDADDLEQDETDQELSTPPAQRGGRRNDQSPRRDSKQSSNRHGQRRDDDDESPQRDSRHRQNSRRDEDEDTERRDNHRGRDQPERYKQKRQQTPPRKDDNKRGKDEDANNDADDDDDEKDDGHPSEEEMERRIKLMETPDKDLDKNVHY